MELEKEETETEKKTRERVKKKATMTSVIMNINFKFVLLVENTYLRKVDQRRGKKCLLAFTPAQQSG